MFFIYEYKYEMTTSYKLGRTQISILKFSFDPKTPNVTLIDHKS